MVERYPALFPFGYLLLHSFYSPCLRADYNWPGKLYSSDIYHWVVVVRSLHRYRSTLLITANDFHWLLGMGVVHVKSKMDVQEIECLWKITGMRRSKMCGNQCSLLEIRVCSSHGKERKAKRIYKSQAKCGTLMGRLARRWRDAVTQTASQRISIYEGENVYDSVRDLQ